MVTVVYQVLVYHTAVPRYLLHWYHSILIALRSRTVLNTHSGACTAKQQLRLQSCVSGNS